KEEIKTFPYPVSAVSPKGKEAVSINFARLRNTRTDYGYGGNGQAAKIDVQFPEDDGIVLLNLETGEARLIVTIAQVKELVPEIPEDGIEYFNHTLFSRGGSKIFWLARAIPHRNTTSLTVNTDGTNLQRCFPDGCDGSQFDWQNVDNRMVTAKYDDKQYALVLVDDTSDVRCVGHG